MPARMRSSLPLPDPLLARRALSEMRQAMRLGYGLVRETLDQAPLPAPVAAVAGTVLRRVDDLAHGADAAASTVMHGFLTASGIEADFAEARAADALAGDLRRALAELGAPDLRISDGAVREALRRAGQPNAADPARAALLMRRLLEAEMVRPSETSTVELAIFAALLARLQDDPAAGLAPSAALAAALAREIGAAARDPEALTRLFAEFRDHV